MLRAGPRRYFLVATLLGGLVGAMPALAAEPSPRAVIDALLAAWNAHDPENVTALMADDISYLDVTVGKPIAGLDNVREEVIQLFMTAAPDLKWEMKGEPIATADGIAFEWRFSGTNTGSWGADTPATGKSFAFEGVSFVRLKNSKIVYEADYYDGLGFQRQLGWIK
jgi:steroid delta-isomerase-like uncharacterized protein